MIADRVSDIFSRVLELPDVDAESDFFALGGDSLLATRVLSAIAREFGIELSFDDFMLTPTPAALATTIASVTMASVTIASVPR